MAWGAGSELTQSEKNKDKMKTSQESWDSIKRSHIRITGVPEGEGREKGEESVFKEITADSFPSLRRDFDIQHEAKRSPNYLNTERPCPKHTVMKLSQMKAEERPLRAVTEERL